ncbi:MAG: hypothetical protein SLAVMIC_00121 [uncultured marine phage]|uniref:Exodeoxyribonuclease X-like C-terminal domain-containing protein n=1 Tax=uncultured marine phage TaxID=707152 RepID=A0A8D9CBJ1_9VIRU|nr:MAG: hypothetical protein SLAVMIC_00121 [uncultured marine phage]
MKKITKKYTFTFGKYKGKNIKEIIKEEGVYNLLSYINWCKGNIEWFKIKKKIVKDLKSNSYSYTNYKSEKWSSNIEECVTDEERRYNESQISADPNSGMYYSDEYKDLKDLENNSWYH